MDSIWYIRAIAVSILADVSGHMIRSPIKWVGGKSKLRNTIIPMIPEHRCYVEVFGGAAWVLFGKTPSHVEVLNDIDEELINFFEVVKSEPRRLMLSFRWELASRARFRQLLEMEPAKLDQIERAHRFYYLIMASWGGELGSARFQHSRSDGGHGNRLIGALLTLEKRILPAYERLQTVQIECLPWEVCIDRYDSPVTFFYLDPPYPGNRCNYRHNMRSSTDHAALALRLKTVQGKWLLSTYDSSELRDIFASCFFKSVSFPSGMAGNHYKNKEVIVTNYRPPFEDLAASRP
jgi:DNA adenine methylase